MRRDRGGTGVNYDVASWARPTKKIMSPNATDEIKARARELWAEAPGENRRVCVRLFREFGIRYSETSVYSWVRES